MMKWKILKIKRRLKRLWKWIPILWYDEDWDYFFIYNILQKKLELTRDHILNGHHSDSKNVASRIQTAIDLIEAVKTEKYIDAVFMMYSDKELDDKTFFDVTNKGYRKHERAKNLLFKFLNHNLHNWWD